MRNRNDYRLTTVIDSKSREFIHSRKDVDVVKTLERVFYPSPTETELREEIDHVQRIFKSGDKMYKFAYDFYGDTDHWWIIAWYNNKPTDAHFKVGDTVYIPKELDVAIRIATRER
jgi:hypothetical protein|tara:strand:- start:6539 stop:6886 length:348 start_codon:yes stop_codon:yes gene_type:complete